MDLSAIDGYLQPGAALALAMNAADQLVRRVPGDFVEVGSYKGRSTVLLASMLRLRVDHDRVLHAIDPHDGVMDWPVGQRVQFSPTLQEFRENLVAYNVETWVRVHVGTVDTFDLPAAIALTFIDGLHDRESVLHDAMTLLPAMSLGGLMCFHDYCDQWPGVFDAVNTLLRPSMHRLAMVEVVDTLAVLRVG